MSSNIRKAEPLSLLRLPDVVARVGYRRSRIYEMVQAGTFPAPVRLGPRAVAWNSVQVDAWIAARLAGVATLGPKAPVPSYAQKRPQRRCQAHRGAHP